MIAVLNLFDIIPGKEAQYAQYLRRVQPILDRYGARVLLYGLTKMIFTGNYTQEYCGLIAYKELGDLMKLSRDPEFLQIVPLRDNSTSNYVLTAIEDFETMNHAAEYLEQQASKSAGGRAPRSARRQNP
ncbi:MAG: DUF1330 domain-containing protein [Phycisphaerae bacterium]|nr:DUF1330 domain-containing protein [Phycisphaerae bacterium]